MNKTAFLTLLLSFSFSAFSNFNFYKDPGLRPIDIKRFGDQLTKEIFSGEGWPQVISKDDKEYEVKYSINEKLTKYIKKELRRYRSDFASVVVIDNNTGKIISAIDYTRDSKKFGKNLTFSSTNPAASIFKVITAADLIENTNVESDTLFSYAGKSTTLYKYQLRAEKNRWTRQIPLNKAFALSNNVVFGKAAIKKTNYNSLSKMAHKFGFNKDNLQVLDLGNSIIFEKGDSYNLAELASGFNRKTMMSPVHGAIIASVIANDGVLRKPTVVDKITDKKYDRTLWEPPLIIERALSKDGAKSMQELMEMTVRRGTARSAFRRPYSKLINRLKIGGKTGTITGGIPYGKRDWFVSYAMPENSQDKGISICVMNVNVKKWYIKSTVFARKVIEHYYKYINKV